MLEISCHLKQSRYDHSLPNTKITETQRIWFTQELTLTVSTMDQFKSLPSATPKFCVLSKHLRIQGNLQVPDPRHPATSRLPLLAHVFPGFILVVILQEREKGWGESCKISRRGRPRRKERGGGGHSPHQLRGSAELRSSPAKSHHHASTAELVRAAPEPGFYVISRAPAP